MIKVSKKKLAAFKSRVAKRTAARKIQSAFRRRRPQARFAASRSQYNINRAVSKAMSRMSETKLVPLSAVNPGAANGTPSNVLGAGSNARAYAWRGVLDVAPTNWDSGLVNLQGIRAPQGDAVNEHVGNYIYLKKTTVNIQLDLVYNSNINASKELQFRMIVCKARQLAVPAGTTDLPQTTLFLNQIGTKQGVDSIGNLAMSTFELMNNPINRRDWVVQRDQKFFLTNPANENSKYPSRRDFRLTLPHYAKTKVTTAGEPLDYDAKYIIYIFATVPGALTNTQLPDDFRVALRGSTSFTDN